jgi:hypothetical protein
MMCRTPIKQRKIPQNNTRVRRNRISEERRQKILSREPHMSDQDRDIVGRPVSQVSPLNTVASQHGVKVTHNVSPRTSIPPSHCTRMSFCNVYYKSTLGSLPFAFAITHKKQLSILTATYEHQGGFQTTSIKPTTSRMPRSSKLTRAKTPNRHVDEHTIRRPEPVENMRWECCGCGSDNEAAEHPARCDSCGHFWCYTCED